ncbi:hypothetical protein GJ496_005851 [Pomphorhynchus laevis]|nr:hypothetical protein GJ496_005851 [Pomphorhynchus laevis]
MANRVLPCYINLQNVDTQLLFLFCLGERSALSRCNIRASHNKSFNRRSLHKDNLRLIFDLQIDVVDVGVFCKMTLEKITAVISICLKSFMEEAAVE